MEFRIQFNGKNYGSVDEMAADERQRYEQAMKSIAPLLSDARVKESTHVWDGPAGIHTSVHTRIVVNDRTFKGPDELPPELKQQHDEAMRNLGAKASGGITLSVQTHHHSASGDAPSAGDPQQRTPANTNPGMMRVEINFGRTLLGIVSVAATIVAAWLLFGPMLTGRH
jgi:hypothetical protein